MALRIAASGAVSSNSRPSPTPLQSEVAPERGEIGRHGLGPHFVVKAGEHVDADGLVGGCENAVDRPVLLVIAAGGNHAAHRVLQAEAIIGALADFDIGEQAEHRAAPIFASPGAGVVEALVAGLRQALWHVAHHRLPDFLRR